MNMNPIAILEAANPNNIVSDEQKYSQFYARVKAATEELKPETATLKGRDEIASMAYKVTRTKTALDAAGKALNEEAQKTINAVNASRKKIRDELDTLAKNVRKPLTEWEDAEDARKADIEEFFAEIDLLVLVGASETSDEVMSRIHAVTELQFKEKLFLDRADEAIGSKANALISLRKIHETLLEREDEARELEQLRAEKAESERLAREKEEREAAEKSEAERAEREAAEIKRREEQASENARLAAEKSAAEELTRVAAEKQAVIDAQEKAEKDRLAEEQRIVDEQSARDADEKHRNAVKSEVLLALKTLGAANNTAQKIMLAILAGEIPNVTLRF